MRTVFISQTFFCIRQRGHPCAVSQPLHTGAVKGAFAHALDAVNEHIEGIDGNMQTTMPESCRLTLFERRFLGIIVLLRLCSLRGDVIRTERDAGIHEPLHLAQTAAKHTAALRLEADTFITVGVVVVPHGTPQLLARDRLTGSRRIHAAHHQEMSPRTKFQPQAALQTQRNAFRYLMRRVIRLTGQRRTVRHAGIDLDRCHRLFAAAAEQVAGRYVRLLAVRRPSVVRIAAHAEHRLSRRGDNERFSVHELHRERAVEQYAAVKPHIARNAAVARPAQALLLVQTLQTCKGFLLDPFAGVEMAEAAQMQQVDHPTGQPVFLQLCADGRRVAQARRIPSKSAFFLCSYHKRASLYCSVPADSCRSCLMIYANVSRSERNSRGCT